MDKKHTGRPSERGDRKSEIKKSIRSDPIQSIRRRSDDSSTLHRAMTSDLGYKAWKATKVQFLSDNHVNRVECCRQILAKYDNNVRRDRLFFSDECALYCEGRGQVTGLCFWSKQNPHFYKQIRQHPPKVMVWAAVSGRHLIGPFFLTGGINQDTYIRMLREEFVPALQVRGILQSAHFQQDGAPAHTAFATREFLNATFQDRCVGKYGPSPWHARSPDLTSCDNALWGIIKSKLNARKFRNADELKEAVRQEFSQISLEMLNNINKRTFSRFHKCIEVKGLQVESY